MTSFLVFRVAASLFLFSALFSIAQLANATSPAAAIRELGKEFGQFHDTDVYDYTASDSAAIQLPTHIGITRSSFAFEATEVFRLHELAFEVVWKGAFPKADDDPQPVVFSSNWTVVSFKRSTDEPGGLGDVGWIGLVVLFHPKTMFEEQTFKIAVGLRGIGLFIMPVTAKAPTPPRHGLSSIVETVKPWQRLHAPLYVFNPDTTTMEVDTSSSHNNEDLSRCVHIVWADPMYQTPNNDRNAVWTIPPNTFSPPLGQLSFFGGPGEHAVGLIRIELNHEKYAIWYNVTVSHDPSKSVHMGLVSMNTNGKSEPLVVHNPATAEAPLKILDLFFRPLKRPLRRRLTSVRSTPKAFRQRRARTLFGALKDDVEAAEREEEEVTNEAIFLAGDALPNPEGTSCLRLIPTNAGPIAPGQRAVVAYVTANLTLCGDTDLIDVEAIVRTDADAPLEKEIRFHIDGMVLQSDVSSVTFEPQEMKDVLHQKGRTAQFDLTRCLRRNRPFVFIAPLSGPKADEPIEPQPFMAYTGLANGTLQPLPLLAPAFIKRVANTFVSTGHTFSWGGNYVGLGDYTIHRAALPTIAASDRIPTHPAVVVGALPAELRVTQNKKMFNIITSFPVVAIVNPVFLTVAPAEKDKIVLAPLERNEIVELSTKFVHPNARDSFRDTRWHVSYLHFGLVEVPVSKSEDTDNMHRAKAADLDNPSVIASRIISIHNPHNGTVQVDKIKMSKTIMAGKEKKKSHVVRIQPQYAKKIGFSESDGTVTSLRLEPGESVLLPLELVALFGEYMADEGYYQGTITLACTLERPPQSMPFAAQLAGEPISPVQLSLSVPVMYSVHRGTLAFEKSTPTMKWESRQLDGESSLPFTENKIQLTSNLSSSLSLTRVLVIAPPPKPEEEWEPFERALHSGGYFVSPIPLSSLPTHDAFSIRMSEGANTIQPGFSGEIATVVFFPTLMRATHTEDKDAGSHDSVPKLSAEETFDHVIPSSVRKTMSTSAPVYIGTREVEAYSQRVLQGEKVERASIIFALGPQAGWSVPLSAECGLSRLTEVQKIDFGIFTSPRRSQLVPHTHIKLTNNEPSPVRVQLILLSRAVGEGYSKLDSFTLSWLESIAREHQKVSKGKGRPEPEGREGKAAPTKAWAGESVGAFDLLGNCTSPSIIIAPNTTITLGPIVFDPFAAEDYRKQHKLTGGGDVDTDVLLIRNNNTVFEAVVLQGQRGVNTLQLVNRSMGPVEFVEFNVTSEVAAKWRPRVTEWPSLLAIWRHIFVRDAVAIQDQITSSSSKDAQVPQSAAERIVQTNIVLHNLPADGRLSPELLQRVLLIHQDVNFQRLFYLVNRGSLPIYVRRIVVGSQLIGNPDKKQIRVFLVPSNPDQQYVPGHGYLIQPNDQVSLRIVCAPSFFMSSFETTVMLIPERFSEDATLEAPLVIKVKVTIADEVMREFRHTRTVTLGECLSRYFVLAITCFVLVLFGSNVIRALKESWNAEYPLHIHKQQMPVPPTVDGKKGAAPPGTTKEQLKKKAAEKAAAKKGKGGKGSKAASVNGTRGHGTAVAVAGGSFGSKRGEEDEEDAAEQNKAATSDAEAEVDVEESQDAHATASTPSATSTSRKGSLNPTPKATPIPEAEAADRSRPSDVVETAKELLPKNGAEEPPQDLNPVSEENKAPVAVVVAGRGAEVVVVGEDDVGLQRLKKVGVMTDPVITVGVVSSPSSDGAGRAAEEAERREVERKRKAAAEAAAKAAAEAAAKAAAEQQERLLQQERREREQKEREQQRLMFQQQQQREKEAKEREEKAAHERLEKERKDKKALQNQHRVEMGRSELAERRRIVDSEERSYTAILRYHLKTLQSETQAEQMPTPNRMGGGVAEAPAPPTPPRAVGSTSGGDGPPRTHVLPSPIGLEPAADFNQDAVPRLSLPDTNEVLSRILGHMRAEPQQPQWPANSPGRVGVGVGAVKISPPPPVLLSSPTPEKVPATATVHPAAAAVVDGLAASHMRQMSGQSSTDATQVLNINDLLQDLTGGTTPPGQQPDLLSPDGGAGSANREGEQQGAGHIGEKKDTKAAEANIFGDWW